MAALSQLPSQLLDVFSSCNAQSDRKVLGRYPLVPVRTVRHKGFHNLLKVTQLASQGALL